MEQQHLLYLLQLFARRGVRTPVRYRRIDMKNLQQGKIGNDG